jgi:hypothetical protein
VRLDGYGERVRRLRILSVAVAPLAVVALVACQKPTPGVTLQSGSRAVRASATVYERGGRQITGSHAVKVLKVHPGDHVNVDVDKSLADKGWSVTITSGTSKNDTVTTPVLHQQNFSFGAGSATSDVVISERGSGTTPSGLWAFTLQPIL